MFEFSSALWGLLGITFAVAATHTISPDHWFGFVMLGRSKKWGIPKTLAVASVAGVGHVGTSVILGLIGVWAGATLAERYASIAETATGWALIVFGFAFALYSYLKGGHSHHGIPIVNKIFHIDNREAEKLMHVHAGGEHEHAHGDHDHDDDDHDHDDDDDDHDHDHDHEGHHHEHDDDDDDDDHHDHDHKPGAKKLEAGYGLVAIIGLTPCILLIPLALRAGEISMQAVIWTMIVFFVATMAAILILVTACLKGLQLIKFEFFEKYGEIITGVVIGIMGVLVVAGLI
ncbi:MAG: hypothetical protein C4555_05025 [Dehalococcoidia bacterium]|nr:MAG: hypothetical protein C4555_05025 [Dehalococcoidia bacterium]